MTAHDILRIPPREPSASATPVVTADASLSRLLSLMLDSPSGTVAISGEESESGVITAMQLLEACASMMPQRPESSTITLTCATGEFLASAVARAVEDADAHLLDMNTLPSDGGLLRVVLRVSRIDPAPVARSLERYGFTVSAVEGDFNTDHDLALSRLEELRRYFDL